MSIEASTKGVTEFLDDNDKLIEEIRGTADDAIDQLQDLFKILEKNRKQAEELVSKIDSMKFAVSNNEDVKKTQKQLLEEIREVSKKIQSFQDNPSLCAAFLGVRARLRFDLGKTFIKETVQTIVPFTPDEIQELRGHLRKAVLDTVARQKRADILDATVQISKLAIKVAVKLIV